MAKDTPKNRRRGSSSTECNWHLLVAEHRAAPFVAGGGRSRRRRGTVGRDGLEELSFWQASMTAIFEDDVRSSLKQVAAEEVAFNKESINRPFPSNCSPDGGPEWLY